MKIALSGVAFAPCAVAGLHLFAALAVGDATNPLTWEQTADKFRRLTALVVRHGGAEPVIAAIRELENINGRDLASQLREAI